MSALLQPEMFYSVLRVVLLCCSDGARLLIAIRLLLVFHSNVIVLAGGWIEFVNLGKASALGLNPTTLLIQNVFYFCHSVSFLPFYQFLS